MTGKDASPEATSSPDGKNLSGNARPDCLGPDLSTQLTAKVVSPRVPTALRPMALEFSAQARQQIDRLLTRYPNKQAALLPVLHVAQDEFGYLPDEALELVAKTLELPPSHVYGVITFYTMFHRQRTGGNHLMVCTNVSCML